jgi:hypothetical protein
MGDTDSPLSTLSFTDDQPSEASAQLLALARAAARRAISGSGAPLTHSTSDSSGGGHDADTEGGITPPPSSGISARGVLNNTPQNVAAVKPPAKWKKANLRLSVEVSNNELPKAKLSMSAKRVQFENEAKEDLASTLGSIQLDDELRDSFVGGTVTPEVDVDEKLDNMNLQDTNGSVEIKVDEEQPPSDGDNASQKRRASFQLEDLGDIQGDPEEISITPVPLERFSSSRRTDAGDDSDDTSEAMYE